MFLGVAAILTFRQSLHEVNSHLYPENILEKEFKKCEMVKSLRNYDAI